MTPLFPDLAGETIWVTGGAGYLGTPIAMTLAKAGAKVICLELPGKAEALLQGGSMRNITPEAVDLSTSENAISTAEKLLAKHGVPSGLVHLAFTSSTGKRMEELEASDFRRTMEGGLTATFMLCRTMAEVMTKGSIVLFSSMYGIVSPDPFMYRNEMKPNPVDYGTSKAGVLQMMRYFAVHYGRKGVRFNCISPGAFPTPHNQVANPDFTALQKQKIPLGRPGNAPEIAGPTLFLLSQASSYVTGHNLVVDGGWTIW